MATTNILLEKSFSFALKSVELYKILVEKKEFVLSKQLLRSGTSVGANVSESEHAQTKRDFIHKLSIAQKECGESIYWLKLLQASGYMSMSSYRELNDEATQILKILKRSIITAKQSLASK